MQEMIFLQAQSDGRAADLVLNQACSRDVTDLELTALNQDFDTLGLKPLRDLFYFLCAPFKASRRLPRPLIKPLPRPDSFGQKYSAITSQT